MHPTDFEQKRAGDCEDHALWAWRVLHELGHDVRLMLGQQGREGHAWVQLYDEASSRIMETTAKYSVPSDIASQYVPRYSLKRLKDGRFVMFDHQPAMVRAAEEFPELPLSQPPDWHDIDRLIFEGKKSEAHEAVRQALKGKGSHTRAFLDRYFFLRNQSPEMFTMDDETYWQDWVG